MATVSARDLCTCTEYRRPSDLSGPKQLDLAACLARRHGLTRAAAMIEEDRARRYPIRGWEYGACIWCEVIDGKRRQATQTDMGGGPPTCDKHADPDEFPDPPFEQWSHAELASIGLASENPEPGEGR